MNDTVDVVMTKMHETSRAVLMTDGLPDEAVWLPLSQIEIQRNGGGNYTVTMPEWLAMDKGLI